MTDINLMKAIRFDHPEVIPVSVWLEPAVWLKYGAEVQKIVDRYPQFFNGFKADLAHPETLYGGTYVKGTHVDEWGCVWSNVHDGMEAIVTGHPVQTVEDIYALKIPENRDGRLPHGFMYLRLLDLCGFEFAMTLFGDEDLEDALQTLIDKVRTYNEYQIDAILPAAGDMVSFGDDLGMQRGLAIGPERWRKYMKPCFTKLYSRVKAAKPETLIYMHTDGCIYEIMPDLIDCGIDMINPQFRANGLDNLVRVCRNEQRIPINLDLDRQLFPVGTPEQIRTHVKDCIEALYLPEGGLGLNVEFSPDVPLENMEAALSAVEKYRFYKG